MSSISEDQPVPRRRHAEACVRSSMFWTSVRSRVLRLAFSEKKGFGLEDRRLRMDGECGACGAADVRRFGAWWIEVRRRDGWEAREKEVLGPLMPPYGPGCVSLIMHAVSWYGAGVEGEEEAERELAGQGCTDGVGSQCRAAPGPPVGISMSTE
jgi:hypothetical protein